MWLVFHGGNCCGIKTIKGFNSDPNQKVDPIKAETKRFNHDKYGQEVNSSLPFFTDSAPAESGIDRLDRYIRFCKLHRPAGLIEVTLAKGNGYSYQDKWFPILEERGFQKVIEGRNSNTGNTVTVWYLQYDEKKNPTLKPEEVVEEEEDDDDEDDDEPCDCPMCQAAREED